MASVSAADTGMPAESSPYIEARYRYGNLHSDGAPRRGHANTLRARLGYHWAGRDGWDAYGELLRTWSLFGRQYDDGSGTNTPYPAEADPASTGVSNAWLGVRQGPLSVRLGRQYMRLDGDRFISNNPWRQNLQSFDGISLAWFGGEGAELRYAWFGRVNRTPGPDFPDRDQRRWKLDAHLLHVDQRLPLGKLGAYAYFIRNDTVATNSVRTFGARWTGTASTGGDSRLAWVADVARQHAYANHPARFDLGYHLAEATWGVPALSVRAGQERLGGNGRVAVNVAYGAARAFNGWVVAFKVPASGLRERYAGLLGKVGSADRPVRWQLMVRRFRAVQGGALLGHERDAGIGVDLSPALSIDLQYGDYRAGRHGVDERKGWLIGEYRFGTAPR